MGIATYSYNRSTSGGEIITHLVNSTDGQGLDFANGALLQLTYAAGGVFGTADFSIEFIINQSSANSNNKILYTSGGSNEFQITSDTGSSEIELTFDGTDYNFSYDMSADYGSPVHYVMTFDRSALATLYKDGNSVATVDISGSSSVNLDNTGTAAGYLGGVSNYGVTGVFYRWRTWKKLLSAAEVTACYENASVPITDQWSNCVTDLDFAFANPEMSLQIQSRSGAGDATASVGISQVTPIEQLNSKSARIGTSAATPADGELVAQKVTVNDTTAGSGWNTIGSFQRGGDEVLAVRSNGDNAILANNDTAGYIGFATGTGAPTRLTIDSAGAVKIGAGGTAATDAALTVAGSSANNKGPRLILSRNDVNIGFLATESTLAGNNSDDVMLYAETGHGIKIATNGNVTPALSIDSAGAVALGNSALAVSNGLIQLRGANAKEGIYVNSGTDEDHTLLNLTGQGGGGELQWVKSNTSFNFTKGVTETNGVLKSNLLSNSGFDVWSNSTLVDASTGAASVQTGADSALTTGGSLVVNGGFDSATTGWVDAFNASLANVSGGQTGNCLEITRSGGSYQTARASANIATVVGKLYELSVWVKSGTSGDEAFIAGYYDGSSQFTLIEGTSSGSWVQYTAVFEATVTTTKPVLQKMTSTAGTMLFDTVTLNEVSPGCVANDTLACDGWYKDAHANSEMWRMHSDGDTEAVTKVGSFYALKMTFAGAGYETKWSRTLDALEFVSRFAGRTVTAGCWMKSSAATLLKIDDSAKAATTVAHDGDNEWQWLELTSTFAGNISWVTPFVIRAVGTETVYISQPILVYGSAIGAGNYSKPSGEIVYCEAKITSKIPATISSATDLNVESDTNGKLPKGAKAVDIIYAGSNAVIEKYLLVENTALIQHSQVANVIISQAGWVPLESDTNLSFTPEGTWNEVFAQYHGVQLQ